MLAPLSVTVPVVVLLSVVPARIASIVPLDTVYPPVLVNVPLVMLPLPSVTAPTESVKPPRSNVPPLSVTAPVDIASAIPSVSVPALIVVVPV